MRANLDTARAFSQSERMTRSWLRTIHPIAREHLTVYCSDCHVSAEVCVQRADGDDALKIAAERFLKAGWFADGLGFGRKKPDEARWLCPKCAKAERRS